MIFYMYGWAGRSGSGGREGLLHHRKHLFLGDKVQHRERRHLVSQILERRPNVVNHIVDDDETVVDLAHVFQMDCRELPVQAGFLLPHGTGNPGRIDGRFHSFVALRHKRKNHVVGVWIDNDKFLFRDPSI